MKNKFLAIDIGGTRIKICKFDQKYKLTESKEISTSKLPVGGLKFIDGIKNLIKENLETGITKLGISFNCSVHNGVVLYSSMLGGQVDYPLVEEFTKEFNLEVNLINDVNAMALAESKYGKGGELHSFVLLNIGTGLRLSYVNNGNLIKGFNSNAGEIAQKEITVSELNKVYKIDELVSGKGVTNIYKDLTGNKLSAEEVFQQAKNDSKAQEAISIFTKYFTQLLTEISYYYNPQQIIINGSLKKSAEKFLDLAEKDYHENVINIFHVKKIKLSKLEQGACLGSLL